MVSVSSFSQILISAAACLNNSQIDEAKSKVFEANTMIEQHDWESLSTEELNKEGYSLHRLASDVAYRVSYECYAGLVKKIETFVKECPGKNLALSNFYINECKPIKGIELSKKVIENSHDLGEKHDAGNILSLGYMYLGQYSDAIDTAQTILSETSNKNFQVNLWRRIADANMAMENFNDAQVALEKAESIFDSHADILLQLTTRVRKAILFSRSGKHLAALQKFKEALESLPAPNVGQKSLIIGNVGATLEKMNRPVDENLLTFFKDYIGEETDDLPMQFVKFAYVNQGGRYTKYILSANLIKMHEKRGQEVPAEYYEIQKQNNECVHCPSGWDVL